MKAKITGSTPKLDVGQLWQKKGSGTVYLACRPGTSKEEIVLLNTETYTTLWAFTGGFGGDDADFTYVGNLEIVE